MSTDGMVGFLKWKSPISNLGKLDERERSQAVREEHVSFHNIFIIEGSRNIMVTKIFSLNEKKRKSKDDQKVRLRVRNRKLQLTSPESHRPQQDMTLTYCQHLRPKASVRDALNVYSLL